MQNLELIRSVILSRKQVYKLLINQFERAVWQNFPHTYFEEPCQYQKLCLRNHRHVYTTMDVPMRRTRDSQMEDDDCPPTSRVN